MIKVSIICKNCGSEFSKILRSSKLTAYRPIYCSRVCYWKDLSVRQQGENNPNFGHKWSEIQKLKQRELIKSKVDNDYRQKVGSANRGKKFSPERIKACHSNRTPESYSHPHSDEIKQIIGEKSKEKFTDDFKEKMRLIQEQKGNWIPLNQKTDWEIYKHESNWIDSMLNYITDNIQLTLLKEHKLFHNIENKSGVVRDHMYSRSEGFRNKVFPEILRHPANCSLILHAENASKNSKSSVTLNELFNNIKSFKDNWKEHNICLALIKDYELGKRWERNKNE